VFLDFTRWPNENVERHSNNEDILCVCIHPKRNGDNEDDEDGKNIDNGADDDLREKEASTDEVGNAGRDG
jgi:hypothetical protein